MPGPGRRPGGWVWNRVSADPVGRVRVSGRWRLGGRRLRPGEEQIGITPGTQASIPWEVSRVPRDSGVKRHAQGFSHQTTGPLESSSDELPLDLLMRLELAGIHAPTNLSARGAEFRTPLDEQIEHLIIKRDQGIRPLTLGFE